MSSSYLYKLTTRMSAAPVRRTALRPTSFVTRTPFLRRTAATTPPTDPKNPTAGPTSDSTNEGDIKSSRATDDPSTTEHGGSIAQPVSGKGDIAGQSEEGDAPVKRDPDASPEEKRKSVEKEGQKPLDAADK